MMIIVTGLSVTDRIWSRIAWPQPGTLVSTTTTQFVVTNAAVVLSLPGAARAPLIRYRMSLTSSICAVFCWAVGDATATAWTCDLTEEYVRLNSAYTT